MAGLAARALGWAPATFWAATPAELAAALAPADPTPPALTRAELARLMEHDDDHD
nr:phage tail assembly chaperone [Qipengyuania sp. YIM B01966]